MEARTGGWGKARPRSRDWPGARCSRRLAAADRGAAQGPVCSTQARSRGVRCAPLQDSLRVLGYTSHKGIRVWQAPSRTLPCTGPSLAPRPPHHRPCVAAARDVGHRRDNEARGHRRRQPPARQPQRAHAPLQRGVAVQAVRHEHGAEEHERYGNLVLHHAQAA